MTSAWHFDPGYPRERRYIPRLTAEGDDRK
jgi:hypothetical protein